MRRPTRHIIFWIVYIIQDALLHYTWMAPAMKQFSVNDQVWMAISTSLVLLLPKLGVVYYFIFLGLQKLMDDKKRLRSIIESIFIILVSILVFRLIFYNVVIPVIYLIDTQSSFLDPKNTLIAALDMGYITGVAIALKLMRLQSAAREREKNLMKEKLEAELKFLKNQTNPHFLFNTLNNIYALARKKSDQTPEAVMKLSELLSFMLYESGKETIAIADEIRMIEDYLALEKLRYSDRLSIRLNKKIDYNSKPITPLLFLPLVENAFKHGVSETRFDSFVDIRVSLQNAQLVFRIENSAEPVPSSNKSETIGLQNIKRQLELLYKEHELTTANKDGIFTVQLNINLDSYGKV